MLPLGLAALSVLVATPALAQLKTSAPQTSAPTPVPTSEPATMSVVASPSIMASPSVAASPSAMVTSLRVASPSAEATPSAAAFGGFSIPAIPKMPVPLNIRVDLMSNGSVNSGGFVAAQTAIPNQTMPALAQASPSISASGMNLGIETSLLFVDLGARMTNFSFNATSSAEIKKQTGVTQTTVSDFTSFFPSSLYEIYGRLLGIKVGYRSETYADGSTYGDLIGGLNLGVSFLDMIGVTAELQGGTAITKPTLPASVGHYVGDFDGYLFGHLGVLRGRLGYKVSAAANADIASLMSLFSDPASLVKTGGALTPEQSATKLGTYSGPYIGIELDF